MAFGGVNFLTIAGMKVKFTEFRRFTIDVQGSEIQAQRTQPPFIDYSQDGFAGGINTSAEANDAGNTVNSMLAMEPIGPDGNAGPWLRIGKQIRRVTALAASHQAADIMAFKGKLIIASTSTDAGFSIQQWNGTALTTEAGLPNGGAHRLFTYRNNAVAFNDRNPGYNYDLDATGAWTSASNGTASGSGVHAAASIYASSTARLYFAADEGAGAGTQAVIRYLEALGAAATAAATLEERFCRAMIADGTTIYIAGADTTTAAVWGTLYSLSGTTLSVVARLADDYIVAAEKFKGQLYFGTNNGKLYVLEGDELTLVRTFNIDLVGPPAQQLRGIHATPEALWVGFTEQSGTLLAIWRFDGEAWTQPHIYPSTPANLNVNRLVTYQGRRVLNVGSTHGIYEVSSGNFCSSGRVELNDVLYGGQFPKGWVEVAAYHSALKVGQSVQLRHKLNGSTAEITDTINEAVGSVESILAFNAGTVGARVRPHLYLTNVTATGAGSTAGSTNTIELYGARVRALAAPGEKEIWTAELDLRQRSEAFSDGTTDRFDALAKFHYLQARKDDGGDFQAIDPFREDTATGTPKAAMMARFDNQEPFEWDLGQLATGAEILVPVKMVQSRGDVGTLSNGNFEADAVGTSGNNITAWTQTATTSSGQASISTAQFAVGAKSLALTMDGTPQIYGMTQTITGLTGGRYYTIRGRIKRSLSAGQFNIQVSSTGLVANTEFLTSATDDEFYEYRRVFQLPAANSAATIRLQGTSAGGANPTGTVWVDGVRLTE